MTRKAGEVLSAPIEKACEKCGTKAWPRAELVGKPHGKGVILCVVCMGRAIESVTGWRMLRMFAQFVALSPIGKGLSKKEKDRLL